MFIKKKRNLITIFVAILAAVLLCLGVTLLTPKTRTARAYSMPPCEFPTTWKNSFYYSDLTEIQFVRFAPEGYSDSGKTLNTDIKIYTDDDGTKIAFVFNGDITAPEDCFRLFSNLPRLTEIKFDNFDTGNVTDMSYMFYGCGSLKSITFGAYFDTFAVTDMSSMFSGCGALSSLDLSDFDVSNVTSMRQMFFYCTSLTTLDLSNFDTSENSTGGVDLAGMFSWCRKLETLILSDKFVSSNVNNISGLFGGCEALTSIDLSKFDLTNVTDISALFNSCTNLASVTFPASFDTTEVVDMNNLFNACKALTSVDLSNLNTANVQNMGYMFKDCSALSSITFGDNFDTSNAKSFSSMFKNCSALTELDLSNFIAEDRYLAIDDMFSGCTNLAKLSVSESLAQKITEKEDSGYSKSQLYTVCEKWYDLDGAEYSTTNSFTAAGTYFTTIPKFVVYFNNGSEVYETLYDAWTAANKATNATIKMNVDAEVEGILTVDAGNDIVLDLKGNKITNADDGCMVINGTFKLEDNGTGTHTITSPVTNKEVTIIGGLITGVNGAVGAVSVMEDGTFTMEGGTIAGNTASIAGGAVCCMGTFNFNGGNISHNKASAGGGVCIYLDDATFVMGNGEISHNEATVYGGGVYNNGTFNVNGAPKITDNTVSGNANNVFVDEDGKISVTGELTDGAKIGISGAGEVATGFTQTTGKPSDFFIPDNPEYVCVYVSDKAAGTVNFSSAHSGGAATCIHKAVCEMCGEEYGELDGDVHTFDKLVIVSATDKYSAFDAFDLATAEVYTHCSACNQIIDKLSATEITVTYSNGNCLHAEDTHVLLSANVGGQTLYSDEYSVTVNKRGVTVVWEYTTSEVSSENAWEWNEITEGSHFVYDGTSKSYRVRARFTGADNDLAKDTYYYRAVDSILLVDGSGEKGIENAAVYVLSLDGSKFTEYSFTNNSISIEVKPYEITLSDAEVYRWTLGSDKGSLLRNAYIEKTADDVYLYYDPITGNAEGRTYVTRSVVRYRGENTGLNIVLNGGEIADLFTGAGKRSNVEYSGTTAVGAIGKYTAIATLTLNDVSNYRYAGEITVVDSRGMTIVISENGTKAIITKDWYVATIMNGLLMPDGGEYSVSGWTFGEDFTASVPKLEHGDESFNLNNISESDKRISFGLFTDVDMTEMIGETFYRYNFADYVNKSMPSGNYVLRVSVSEVTDLDGLAYQAFTRTFTFTVKKGTLGVTDTLNGREFEYIYNGKVQLFESQFEPTVAAPKYVYAEDRMGIWQNGEFDKFYATAYMTFHLARWQTAGGIGYEFVTRTQLENTLDRKQAPREVDTYNVQYKISALNYEDYGGGTGFTVKIIRRKVAVPTNVTETLIKEYVYEIPENANYRIEGNATFTQSGAHTVTLKLIDADNYEWVAGDNVEGNTATVTVTLTMHDHVYGEWQVDIKPTCTENGSRSKKCTLCGDVTEEQVAVLGHNLTQHEAKSATCTEKGWSAYETCSRCDHTTYKETAALGHNLTHVEHKEATADMAGNIEYWACADCTEYFSDADGETVITDKSSVEIPMLITEDNVVNGLSAGAVAGIVIACVIVVLVAAYVAGYFLLYRKGMLLKGKVFDAIYVPMNAIFNKIEE